ncbi:MAG: hypothetical protein LBG15_03240 [Dysgonamonadaceae bacterium]|jgi:hypothetical protein|nr:hypothetical protein [Dysgonamonadaceae bacterium]
MACLGCKESVVIKRNTNIDKMRTMAKKIAEMEGKTQIILDIEDQLFIDCLSCWEKGGKTGKIVELFIV